MTQSDYSLLRGMVVDIDLNPTKGSQTSKQRPCIIVTNDFYNQRAPIIQVVPITGWSAKKARIKTNVEIAPTEENGLTKRSVADCLQTRPVDHRFRLSVIRGTVDGVTLEKIDQALRLIFAL